MYDVVVVGAGIAGIVAAERCAARGRKVLLVEKRAHLGGNCYDCFDDDGVLIHLYGPHILHTQYEDVWRYLSSFTQWRPYQHRVLAHIDGNLVPLPFNLNTIDALFPAGYAERLVERLVNAYGYGSRVPILDLQKSADGDLQFLAQYVYDKVFLNYTLKQWGLKPEDIDPGVTARVPVLVSRDDRYFQDKYQGMPLHGYTRMFERMLDHPSIHVMLQADFNEIRSEISADWIIYTGPLDDYFDRRHGALPYRALNFAFESYDFEFYQTAAVVNYPNDYDYTRITEFKHLTAQRHAKTVCLREYPCDHVAGLTNPCYPVASGEELAQAYRQEAEAQSRVLFLGRLAEYRYYNMDQVVKRVLDAIAQSAI